MDELIAGLQSADTTSQAFAVTVGGLVGVFVTLGIFFLVIYVSGKVGSRPEQD